jgi:hypothetical protein
VSKDMAAYCQQAQQQHTTRADVYSSLYNFFCVFQQFTT